MPPPDSRTPPWTLVVPVKVLSRAKTRLAAAAGPHRARLALALAGDTVAAALRSPRVAEVVVVTDDQVAAAELSALGAGVVADEPDAGLNPALVHGATRRSAPGAGVGALSADLPALRPEHLTRALDAALTAPRAFVPDAAGTGTTLYTARTGAPFTPAFGPGSRDRHSAQGARELRPDGLAGLRRDVDTLDDLRAALALGVGPRTAAVAGSLGIAAGGAGARRRDEDAAGPAGARPFPGGSGAAGTPRRPGRVRIMQATVATYDPETRSGTVLLDDGTELGFGAAAFAAGGLRLLRFGQRVNIAVAGTGDEEITAITLSTLPLPDPPLPAKPTGE